MKNSSLGNRMKENYESIYNYKLPMRLPVIIRLDGKAFHTLIKNAVKPFDYSFIHCMDQTAKYLCENIQGAQLAYIQSDEISILLHNYKRLNSQAWFNNEIQKMTSISAALASSYFTATNYEKLVQFDSRVFVLPESEVCNYFIWRQQDWERNSIQMLAHSLYSHKELHKKNMVDMQELCFQKGKNWNDLDTHLKRGRCIYKTVTETGDWTNTIEELKTDWILDKEIPIFTKDRNFIEKWLEIIEE
jgi:tRNA(His) 5'-end guanylyltransferase